MPNSKKQGQKEIEPTFLFNASGEKIYGTKAFHNSELNKIGLNINDKGLSIIFNPSNYRENYKLDADPNSIIKITNEIEVYLKSIGIITNVKNNLFSRIDIAHDMMMDKQVCMYSNAFATLNGKRATQKVTYPDGYRLGNKQRQGMFYDKGKEQNKRESNLMRLEYRTLKSKEVQNFTSGVSMPYQFKDLTPDDLKSFYKKALKEYILTDNKKVFSIDTPVVNTIELIKSLKLSGRRYFMNDLFAYCGGANGLLNAIGGINNLKPLLLASGLKRQNADLQLKKIQQILQDIPQFLNSSIQKDVNELKLKFIG